MLDINRIYCTDCIDGMNLLDDCSIDLVVTSPPYDSLRDYNGYNFNCHDVIRYLYRVLKVGGVVVWVVGDQVVNGSKTLTSFKQAIDFQESGFNVHDVMIYKKKNTPFMRSNAYTNCFEYMFVFSKGSPKTFNPLKDKTARSGYEMLVHNKTSDGVNKKSIGKLNELKTRSNIWEYAVGLGGSTSDRVAFKHPAIFPESLAVDHILSWSSKGDLVLDPFMGSGTTAKACVITGRNYIGFDISDDYCKIAEERVRIAHAEVRGVCLNHSTSSYTNSSKKLF